MKLYLNFNKTVLYTAVEEKNIEIVKLLLENKTLKVNIESILIFLFDEISHYFLIPF